MPCFCLFDITSCGRVEWGCDLASEHEKYLTEIHFKGPVIVYGKTFFHLEKSVKCEAMVAKAFLWLVFV